MRLFVRIGLAVVLIGVIGGGVALAAWGPRAARPASRQPSSGGLVALSTVDGLRMTIRVSSRRDPKNALIRSRLTVANVSRHPIRISGDGCSRLPSVQVLDARERPYRSPAFTQVWECAYRPPLALRPGARLFTTPLVVLRSGRLRPEVTVLSGGSNRTVTGSILHLRLTHDPSPRVVVHQRISGQTGGGFTASVRPAWRHFGPLYVETLESCMQGNHGGGSQTGSPYWHPIAGSTLRTSILKPSCHSQLWHFYAGWIGHPIANFRLAIPKGSQPGY